MLERYYPKSFKNTTSKFWKLCEGLDRSSHQLRQPVPQKGTQAIVQTGSVLVPLVPEKVEKGQNKV